MAESFWVKQKELIRALPNKKQYIEFFTAILSVPIMLTVLVLNINNLKPKDVSPPNPDEKKEVIIVSPEIKGITTQTMQKKEACIEELPSVDILSPESGETVSKRPVCISPQIEEGEYCSVVWRYRVNDSSWSEYDNKGFCLYDLPTGDTSVRIEVKSIVTGEAKEIVREFIYSGPVTTPSPTMTVSPTASGSAQ